MAERLGLTIGEAERMTESERNEWVAYSNIKAERMTDGQ